MISKEEKMRELIETVDGVPIYRKAQEVDPVGQILSFNGGKVAWRVEKVSSSSTEVVQVLGPSVGKRETWTLNVIGAVTLSEEWLTSEKERLARERAEVTRCRRCWEGAAEPGEGRDPNCPGHNVPQRDSRGGVRQSDVKVGGQYLCKVSGRLVRVRVEHEVPAGKGRRTRYQCVNLSTGRKIRATAARLRKMEAK